MNKEFHNQLYYFSLYFFSSYFSCFHIWRPKNLFSIPFLNMLFHYPNFFLYSERAQNYFSILREAQNFFSIFFSICYLITQNFFLYSQRTSANYSANVGRWKMLICFLILPANLHWRIYHNEQVSLCPVIVDCWLIAQNL